MARKRKTVTVDFIIHPGQIFGDNLQDRIETLFLKKHEFDSLDRCVKENLFRDCGISEWVHRHATRHHRRRLRKHLIAMMDVDYRQHV